VCVCGCVCVGVVCVYVCVCVCVCVWERACVSACPILLLNSIYHCYLLVEYLQSIYEYLSPHILWG